MTRLRLWIAGTALGCFVAGMNVGLVAPRLFAAEDPRAVAADENYVNKMVAEYGLSDRQEKSLRMVLQKWREEEVAAFRSAEVRLLPPAVQGELRQARGRMERRVKAVLDEQQRARYDLDTKPK